jgi:hypothetical protein
MRQELYDSLKSYVERIQRYADKSRNWEERETKRFLIEPLLESLGWDPHNPDFVKYEYPVKMGSGTHHADYALMTGESPVCIVEAKPGELNNEFAKQALSYSKILDVPWALVTNGIRICLYGTDFYKNENVDSALVMDISITPDTLDKSFEYIQHLSNGSLDTEEAYNVFKSLNEKNALFVYLKNNKDLLLKEVITNWLEERLGRGKVNDIILNDVMSDVFGKVIKIEKAYERESELTVNKPHMIGKIIDTAAGDWLHIPVVGKGIFEYYSDKSKRIDVSHSGPDVEKQLEKLGLKTSTVQAFGGFYYNLRRIAKLIKDRKKTSP